MTADDYGFLLTLTRFQELPLAQWRECFARDGAEEELRRSRSRKANWCAGSSARMAQTGLMVPRQFPGKDRAIKQLRFSAEILFRVLGAARAGPPAAGGSLPAGDTLVPRSGRGLRVDGTHGARPTGVGDCVETPVVSPFGVRPVREPDEGKPEFEDPEEAIERLYQQFYAGKMPNAECG